MQRILNQYPNYPTHRLYFGEVETSYKMLKLSRHTQLPDIVLTFQKILALVDSSPVFLCVHPVNFICMRVIIY